MHKSMYKADTSGWYFLQVVLSIIFFCEGEKGRGLIYKMIPEKLIFVLAVIL